VRCVSTTNAVQMARRRKRAAVEICANNRLERTAELGRGGKSFFITGQPRGLFEIARSIAGRM